MEPGEVTAKENETSPNREGKTRESSSDISPNGNRKEYMQSSQQSGERPEKPKVGAMEVFVEHNIEKAMKILKRKLIKEGLFKELKSRRYYEKPSEKRKRKLKESMKKARKEEARQKKNPMLFS
jgi:small subunit ribosomal protein S21